MDGSGGNIALSERQKEAWKLVKHENMSYQVAAEMMGITQDTLEKHLIACHQKRQNWQYTIDWMKGNSSKTENKTETE
jgi:DNA-directed RNA polymerase specialized sigma24 family protein